MNKKLTIRAVVALLAALMALGGGQALAASCKVTVTAPDSIQAAIDANPKKTVCLDDSGGVFSQSVVFSGTDGGGDDSGITLRAAPGAVPVLDGTIGSLVDAITLKDGVSKVTIRDLEIRNYSNQAIRGDGTIAVPLSKIRLQDLDIHDINFHAIDILHTDGLRIKHVTVRVAPGANFFAEAIRLQSVDSVKVDKVHVIGGFVGVNFACSGACAGPEPPTNGVVKNSTISGTTDNGVLLANTTDAEIKKNVIAGAGFGGIQIGFRAANPVTGVKVSKNVVTGTAGDGILLSRGSSGSTVEKNTVTGSTGDGIAIVTLAPGGSSSGNTIKGNISNGNGGFGYLDDGLGGGNVFTKNECKANAAGGSSSDGGASATGDLCTPQF